MNRIGRHLRSQFVGYIALVLAMTGTAYALGRNSVSDRELAPNSVGSSEIEPGAVGTQEVDSTGAGDVCGYVGEILHVGFDFAPEGMYMANGQELPIIQHKALFRLYGTKFGGDGVQSFALPKLQPQDGTHYVICDRYGFYPNP